jgi:hypothetical protein
MTRRPLARTRRAALLTTTGALALGLVSLAGCDPRQALYFLQPFEPKIPAPGPSLKGKKVVLIAKSAPGATGDFVSLDRELTREVRAILAQNVKKIELVEDSKVWTWDQAHPRWTDPAELAEAFDADLAIVLEVNLFQIESPSSPDMFEGHSAVHIRVVERSHPKDDRGRELTDRPKQASILYDDDRETTFPVRGPLPASAEVTATGFKNKFLKLVATEISWHFVEHAPGDNIQDADFIGQ